MLSHSAKSQQPIVSRLKTSAGGLKKVLEKEHFLYSNKRRQLASVLRYQGRYDQVEEMNRQTLERTEKLLEKEHADTLMNVYCRDSLGLVGSLHVVRHRRICVMLGYGLGPLIVILLA